ncbi:MAG: ERCC4 domain-containing protein [Geothrix sp.]|nr:ERCC4 domain-containing protein [Geothrix sp.]
MGAGSNGQPIRIWVDDREARGSGIAARLAEMEGVFVTVKRLRTGDYLIEGKAVLERKRVADFLESLRQGRLFSQASRLAASPLRSFLILEGPSRAWRRAGVTREGIQGALVSLAVGFGIPVLRSQDEDETVRLILFTARQLHPAARIAIRRPSRRIHGKRARQIYILTGIPSVGSARAGRLLDEFGTIEGVMAASQETLAEVEGIGTKTAQQIYWAVHECTTPYLS